MPTKDEFIAHSEQRIRDWCKGTSAIISEAAWVAIHSELKTMFEVGIQGRSNLKAILVEFMNRLTMRGFDPPSENGTALPSVIHRLIGFVDANDDARKILLEMGHLWEEVGFNPPVAMRFPISEQELVAAEQRRLLAGEAGVIRPTTKYGEPLSPYDAGLGPLKKG